MRIRLVTWAVCTTLGAVLLALPDTGPRVISISGEHGPGVVDSIGVVALLLGFGAVLLGIVSRRSAITVSLLERPTHLAYKAFLAGVGTGLLVAGVFTDFWWWWLVGAVLLQAFWLSLLLTGQKGAPWQGKQRWGSSD